MMGDSKECDCNDANAFGVRGFWLDRQGRCPHSSLDQFAQSLLGYSLIAMSAYAYFKGVPTGPPAQQ